jgi:hypothetical protein
MSRLEARAAKICFPILPACGLCAAQTRMCMTGRRKMIAKLPRGVKIGGVVSNGPTTWWSLSAKKLLAAHLRLCDKLKVVPRV